MRFQNLTSLLDHEDPRCNALQNEPCVRENKPMADMTNREKRYELCGSWKTAC